MITNEDWGYGNWRIDMPSVARSNINVTETMAVTLAIYGWAPSWQGCHVTIYTDNVTTRAAINKGISKDTLVMSHLHNVFWLCNTFNFTMSSTHIPGSLNIYTDSASRLHNKGHFLHWISVVLGYVPQSALTVWFNLCRHMQCHSWYHLFLKYRNLMR